MDNSIIDGQAQAPSLSGPLDEAHPSSDPDVCLVEGRRYLTGAG